MAPDKAQEQPAAETAPAAEEQAAAAEDSTPAAAAAEEQPTVSTTFVFNDKPVLNQSPSSHIYLRTSALSMPLVSMVVQIAGRPAGR